MVEPLNAKAWQSALDALGTVKANQLEPDLRIAVSAYISALPSLPVVDRGELLEKLRERYTGAPVPPCSVCGKPLSIQSAGGGSATVYGCERHSPFDWKHYERSRWTQYRPGDRDVLDIITRAEAAESRVQSLEEEVKRLREALGPFDVAASALFTRNFNRRDVVAELPVDVSHPAQLRLTAGHFFAARAALEDNGNG